MMSLYSTWYSVKFENIFLVDSTLGDSVSFMFFVTDAPGIGQPSLSFPCLSLEH